jgi:hypothetical protein
MQQLKLFQNHLPSKTRSCDNFDVDNKVRYIKDAIKKRYIQPNNFNSLQWLVFDIDRAVCPDSIRNDNLAPEPTLFVSNPINRHAHLYYLIQTAIHKNEHSSQKAIKFAAAVEYGLAIKLDADMSYVGMLAKNALHSDWEILHTVSQAYELHELAESVDTTLLNKPLKERLNYGLSRNCSVFDEVSKWAYRAIRQGWPQHERWHGAVLARTEMLNSKLQTPMDFSEYKHISKSIASWTYERFTKEGFSRSQSKKGKLGGIAKGNAYEDKHIQARLLHAKGFSFRDIAKQLSCSPQSVSNWVSK